MTTIFLLLELFSTVCFWFIVACTGWWFVFFKLQERVYYLMPMMTEAQYEENYKQFDKMVIFVTIAKFLSLAAKIVF